MRKSPVLAYLPLLALPVLVGLVASSILLVDYTNPAPLFCEAGGGCDRIRQSAFSSFLHVPLPVYGVAGFLAMGIMSLLRGQRARQILLGLSSVAAVAAVFLLSVQVSKDTFCKFCIMVDLSSLVLAAGAFLRFSRAWDPPWEESRRVPVLAGAASLVAAALVPMAVGRARADAAANADAAVNSPEGPLPDSIVAELRQTPRGKITVVDFVDFECPYCRMTHAEFKPMLEEHASQIRLVRKQVPLKMHPNAHDAARAACCGEKLGKGDAMANALFTADDLTPAGCDKVAQSIGLDMTAFHACVQDPATDQRIEKESAEFRDLKTRGLPTIYIGKERIEGMPEESKLREVMSRALASEG